MRSSRPPASASGQLRRAGAAALIALSVGLVVIVVGQGFSSIGVVRALEDIALGVIVAAALMQLLPTVLHNAGVADDWLTILFGIGVLQVLTTAPRGLADQVPKDLARLGRRLKRPLRRTAPSGGDG